MQLAGQGDGRNRADRTSLDERGYIMVVLLVSMAAAAIWMSAALPSWRQQAQREKEAELVYRGEQYARAVALYMRKNNNSLPPNLDILISQRYLRKKYKDPITNDDFVIIGGLMPGQTQGAPASPQAPAQGGVSGVRSKSQAASIRTYFNQTTYGQWGFDGLAMMARMGMRPGGPGGPGGGPGIGNPNGRPGGGPGLGGPGAGGPGAPGGRPGGGGPGIGGPGGGGPVRPGGGPGGAGAPPPVGRPGSAGGGS